jgi:hypothetical protein
MIRIGEVQRFRPQRRVPVKKNKKNGHMLPAVAFIYLAMIGCMIVLSASRVLAM